MIKILLLPGLFSVNEEDGIQPGYVTLVKEGDSLVFVNHMSGNIILKLDPNSVGQVFDFLLNNFNYLVSLLQSKETEISDLKQEIERLQNLVVAYKEVLEGMNGNVDN